MKKKEKAKAPASRQKEKSKLVAVRLKLDEYDKLETLVQSSSATSRSGFMREASLGYKIKSKADVRVAYALRAVRGELGKIGGLFKLYILRLDGKETPANITGYLDDLALQISTLQVDIDRLSGFLRRPDIQAVVDEMLKEKGRV